MQNYKLLTSKSILDIQNEISELDTDIQESTLDNFWNEQTNLIEGEHFAVHFLADKHFQDERYTLSSDILETVECLAIKDGIDIVQFENGNMGFVAYYNGHKNSFEFKAINEEVYEKVSYDELEEDIKELFR
jgi:hypothetical protein